MAETLVTSRKIFEAIEDGNVQYVNSALRDHREILTSKGWVTWLDSAARAGRIEILKLLVEAGADINEPYSDDSRQSPEGVIDLAASEGHLDVVGWMIDQGAIFNHTMSGQTRCFALNNASRRGHIDVVKLLVERGANLKANWAGMTALDHAIAYDKVGVANYLRSVGAKTAQELQG